MATGRFLTRKRFKKEKDLELYISKNLFRVEKGLIMVGRQVDLRYGKSKFHRLDILAKDKNGVFVIIEVKREIKEHVAGQFYFYEDVFKKLFDCQNIRKMVIGLTIKEKVSEKLNNENIEICLAV